MYALDAAMFNGARLRQTPITINHACTACTCPRYAHYQPPTLHAQASLHPQAQQQLQTILVALVLLLQPPRRARCLPHVLHGALRTDHMQMMGGRGRTQQK